MSRTFVGLAHPGVLTDAFPSVFGVHGQHGNVASAEHLLVHVKLAHDGPDALLLHHGLQNTPHTNMRIDGQLHQKAALQ